MCGISGVLGEDAGRARIAIQEMNLSQRHRGPDDEGLESLDLEGCSLVLGHRRLSILDLSSAGHQPMRNPGSGDWIVFNGEIYNFLELRRELEGRGIEFRSRCDTEVILQAYATWGVDAFDRLHGMFALALLDRKRRRLVLARDSLGIKPLYYGWGDRCFIFASELRAIQASGLVDRTVDRQALAGLLAYGAVQGPRTLLKGVRQLEPGSWAQLDLDSLDWSDRRLRSTRYWNYPALEPTTHNPEERQAEIGRLVAAAVRSHLVSDVPVGLFLSSGLDSTALAVLCAEVSPEEMNTFTVGLADQPDLDEGPLARESARRLGLNHHEISVTEDEARELASTWLSRVDQPSIDGLNTFIISRAVRERGIVVSLSGLGGDEVFAGYSSFRQLPRAATLARFSALVPRAARRQVASWVSRGRSSVQRRKLIELAERPLTIENLYFQRRRLLSDAELEQLGLRATDLDLDENMLTEESHPRIPSNVKDDPVALLSVLESHHYMGNMLLRDSDAQGMAHSLEIRVPLLDRPLIDRVYALSGAERVVRGQPNKPLLVGAIADRIPPELLQRKKRGFSLPYANWMAGPLRARFESLLTATAGSGVVDPTGVDNIWNEFLREPNAASWSRAWMLGVLGAWCTIH